MAEEGNFFSRWSRRKADVSRGTVLAEPVQKPTLPNVEVNPPVAPPAQSTAAQEQPVLTLDDVKALTAESDFSPFAAKGVSPDVRNAAMKKLFADPHYNVMDGLDIYIDDYTKADPIPESMMRQMVGAQFLKLFETDAPSDTPDHNGSTNLNTSHAHADLRLQPDPAAGSAQDPGDTGAGLERNPEPAQRPVPP